MTSIETTKEYLSHLNLSDEELREIRDITDELAEAIIRGYWDRHKKKYAKTNASNAKDSVGVPRNGILRDSSRQG